MPQEFPLPPNVVLQRDNQTYAARMSPPSGKLSADDLETMAAIAKKHNIPEIKLTSGQRIAFYGLTRENVHAVCEALPFRTGGHYVQACPGTDWCKFGQQDAMGLAARLDDRYGSFKTPAKIKLGVSGCTFCCAESRLRDIGFIGTPKGWTIVVGGNSGMKPRIADELARGLSTDDALELCQRFLDLYGKEAKAKQRTARFVKALGIDTIKTMLNLPSGR